MQGRYRSSAAISPTVSSGDHQPEGIIPEFNIRKYYPLIGAVLLAAKGGSRKTWHYYFRPFGSEVIVSVILLAAGLTVTEVAEMTGLSSRSVQSTGRAIKDGSIRSKLVRKKNSGRKRKTAGVEEQIIAELEQGNYHTRQQIADMIREKFQITGSLPAVGRVLKKRLPKAEVCFSARKGRRSRTKKVL